jgi:hypothetical protein
VADKGNKPPVVEEQRKLYFEVFKHLTTLNVAAALVLLAIYREGGTLSEPQILLPMGGFGASLCLSLLGMYQTTAKEDIEARGYRIRWSEYAHLTWTLLAFALGILGALVVEILKMVLYTPVQ